MSTESAKRPARERPCLMNAPMVRASLAGTKTQTRRMSGLDEINRDPDRYFFAGMLTLGTSSHATFKDTKTGDQLLALSPYGQPGDRLWVRETWAKHWMYDNLPPANARSSLSDDLFWYRADGESRDPNGTRGKWRPPIHMPRWASRLTLEVESVRVERLQDISEEDAIAEGVEPYTPPQGCIHPDQRVPGAGFDGARLGDQPHRLPFADLWRSINGPESWDSNPWVWTINFRRTQ